MVITLSNKNNDKDSNNNKDYGNDNGIDNDNGSNIDSDNDDSRELLTQWSMGHQQKLSNVSSLLPVVPFQLFHSYPVVPFPPVHPHRVHFLLGSPPPGVV